MYLFEGEWILMAAMASERDIMVPQTNQETKLAVSLSTFIRFGTPLRQESFLLVELNFPIF